MKMARILLTIPTLILSVLFMYLCWGAQADVAVETQTAAAQEYSKTYDSVVAAVQTGAAQAVFTDEAFTGAQDYTLVSMQVTLHNRGALPLEWVTCEYAPGDGDVAVYEIDGLPVDIGSDQEASFFVRLIRKNGGTGAGGQAKITYYVAGQAIAKTIDG